MLLHKLFSKLVKYMIILFLKRSNSCSLSFLYSIVLFYISKNSHLFWVDYMNLLWFTKLYYQKYLYRSLTTLVGSLTGIISVMYDVTLFTIAVSISALRVVYQSYKYMSYEIIFLLSITSIISFSWCSLISDL